MSTSRTFLLHPKNQRFLDGKDRIPWSARPPFWGALSITIGCAVVVLAVLSYFWYEMAITRYLRAHGITVVATVLESSIHMSSEDDRGSITFRYVAQAGNEKRMITCTQNTRPETASRYRKGDGMKVVYDPDNPERVRVADELNILPHAEIPGDHDYLSLKLICGLPAVTGMMSFTIWFATGFLPLMRLRRNPGRVLMAEILEASGDTDAQDNFQVRLRIRFQTPEGKSIESWMKPGHRDDLYCKPLPAPGTPVRVYFVSETQYWCL